MEGDTWVSKSHSVSYCQGLWQADCICDVESDKEDSVTLLSRETTPKSPDSLSSAELMMTPYQPQVLLKIIHFRHESTSSCLVLLICFFLKEYFKGKLEF